MLFFKCFKIVFCILNISDKQYCPFLIVDNVIVYIMVYYSTQNMVKLQKFADKGQYLNIYYTFYILCPFVFHCATSFLCHFVFYFASVLSFMCVSLSGDGKRKAAMCIIGSSWKITSYITNCF